MDWRPEGLFEDRVFASTDLIPDSVAMKIQNAMNENSEESSSAHFDKTMIDIIGCFIFKKITLDHFNSIFGAFEFSKKLVAMTAIADALWFWGTQVAPNQVE